MPFTNDGMKIKKGYNVHTLYQHCKPLNFNKKLYRNIITHKIKNSKDKIDRWIDILYRYKILKRIISKHYCKKINIYVVYVMINTIVAC